MKKLFLLFFLLVISVNNVFAQSGWFWQNPLPQGNRLNSIEYLDNSTIIAVGYGGTILKSSNQGLSWINSNYNYNLYPRDFYAVSFINTNTGWVCGDSGAVMKTTNGGANWYWLTTNSFSKLNNIFAADINNIYTCGDNGTVLISSNGGDEWYHSGTFNGNNFFNKILFVNEDTGFVCGYTNSYTNGILYKTTNKGSSWLSLENVIAYKFVSMDFIDENTGYLGGTRRTGFPPSYYEILMKTTNSGLNWFQLVIPEIYSATIKKVKFYDTNNGYLSLYNYNTSDNIDQILKTSDQGNSWNIISNRFKITSTGGLKDFTFTEDGGIIGVEGYDILRTIQNDTNWIHMTSISGDFIGNRKIQFVNENTGIISSLRKLCKTTDGGNNWSIIRNFQSDAPNFYFLNSETGWAFYDTVYKTTDGGLTWFNQGIANGVSEIFFKNQLTGYCKAHNYQSNLNEIYKTTNSGLNWFLIYSNITGCDNFQFVNINVGFFTKPTNGGQTIDLYKTTNGGLNWQYVSQIVNGFEASLLYFYDEHNAWLTRQDSLYSYKTIYRTTNGGINWDNQNLEYMKFHIIREFKFFSKDVGVAIANINGISDDAYFLKTTDGGLNWNISLPGIAHGITSISFINENTGWICGSYGSILKTTTGGNLISITPTLHPIPHFFSLHQNYPNPFNPVTKIKFDIPKQSNTKIMVYDLLGQEISTLVNEQLKPGTYEINWDGSNYASGVYFYSLVTDEFTETRRMVLIK